MILSDLFAAISELLEAILGGLSNLLELFR